MKIGIFDSGLGGLLVARAIREYMPEYDYVYLGDTKHVPYGNRSHDIVYDLTKRSVEYLFKNENCALIVLACNTASARALRRLQQEYLPENFPNRKVLGVLIPSAEECVGYKKVGVLGTRGTVNSNTFVDEIKKACLAKGGENSEIEIFQNAAPMLVPLVEEGEREFATPFIKKYLEPLQEKNVEAVVLGCTHYPFYKNEIREILGKNVRVISQDEVVPEKLKNYLGRHSEITEQLSHNGTIKILVTDQTPHIEELTKNFFREGQQVELVKV